MTPASLTTLPSEILVQILGYQCRHCCPGTGTWPNTPFTAHHKSDLAAISQTCRRLCGIAQSMLFHDAHPTDILPLLRTVIDRPDLAGQMRGFCNDGCEISEPLPEDVWMFEDQARYFGLKSHNSWVQRMMGHGQTERAIWLLELTLANLPNVTVLSITLPLEYEFGIGNLFRRSVVMKSVKRLYLYHGDCNSCAIDLGHLGDFLGMMPCLEMLEVNRCGGATQYLPLSELRTLIFTQSNLSLASLKRLVTSCPKLERFEYWSPGQYRNIGDKGDQSEREFTSGQAQRILHERRRTLKHLNFEFHNYFPRFAVWPLQPADFLDSFHDFSALQVLLVRVSSFSNGQDDEDTSLSFPASVETLVGMLPQSLTLLGFCGLQIGWDGTDKLVQAIQDGHFPKLERVVLDQDKTEFEVSRDLLAAVGVKCLKYDYKYNPFGRCLPSRWSLRLK